MHRTGLVLPVLLLVLFCLSDTRSLLPAQVMLLPMKEALALAENSLALGKTACASWRDWQDPAHNHSYSAESPNTVVRWLSWRMKTDRWPNIFLTRCYIIGVLCFHPAQECQNLHFVLPPLLHTIKPVIFKGWPENFWGPVQCLNIVACLQFH